MVKKIFWVLGMAWICLAGIGSMRPGLAEPALTIYNLEPDEEETITYKVHYTW